MGRQRFGFGADDLAVCAHGVVVDAVRRTEQAERTGDTARSTDRRDDRGHVGLDAVALRDVAIRADHATQCVADSEIGAWDRFAYPTGVAHSVGALDHRDVDRRVGRTGNAEVGRLAGGGNDAFEAGLGHRDQGLSPQSARAELDEPRSSAKRPVGAASDKARGFERA